MGIQTDKILKDIKNGTSDEASIDFIEEVKIRSEIGKDILADYPSYSKFATTCGIQGSHLSEFLKGTKKFGRNSLLTIFLTLHYDLDRIQTMLTRLGESPLYMRNKRDYRIAAAIESGKSLEEIDQLLLSDNFEPVSPDAKV
ncbi:hypothetical protein FMM75_19660 [Lachnospiraceae bacterium MD335]|nr:hypothetical protein [Lachnospiraceae bacterium MD335]